MIVQYTPGMTIIGVYFLIFQQLTIFSTAKSVMIKNRKKSVPCVRKMFVQPITTVKMEDGRYIMIKYIAKSVFDFFEF